MLSVPLQETLVSMEHQAEEQCQKEARKWATKFAKEGNAIRQYNRQLQQLENDINNAHKVRIMRKLNGWYFEDVNFQWIFLKENVCIWFKFPWSLYLLWFSLQQSVLVSLKAS